PSPVSVYKRRSVPYGLIGRQAGSQVKGFFLHQNLVALQVPPNQGKLLRFRNTEVATNLPGQRVWNLGVPGDCCATLVRWVPPPRVAQVPLAFFADAGAGRAAPLVSCGSVRSY